jgi:hypothetical protein
MGSIRRRRCSERKTKHVRTKSAICDCHAHLADADGGVDPVFGFVGESHCDVSGGVSLCVEEGTDVESIYIFETLDLTPSRSPRKNPEQQLTKASAGHHVSPQLRLVMMNEG